MASVTFDLECSFARESRAHAFWVESVRGKGCSHGTSSEARREEPKGIERQENRRASRKKRRRLKPPPIT
jgi:hypothetical protein